MKSLSIICVYNNERILQDYLLAGLKAQNNQDMELVLLDNRENAYPSASSALNAGARMATTDNLVFAHQDIHFDCPTIIDELLSFFASDLGVFGSSGVGRFKAKMLSNVFTGSRNPKLFANRLCERITEPVEVETLDECFFCMKKDLYARLGGFDEEICNNWHMYAVELTLHAKKEGVSVYAVPLSILHKSGGTISKAYINNLSAVCRKYHKFWMASPCYHFIAFKPFMWCLWGYWQVHYFVLRIHNRFSKKN